MSQIPTKGAEALKMVSGSTRKSAGVHADGR